MSTRWAVFENLVSELGAASAEAGQAESLLADSPLPEMDDARSAIRNAADAIHRTIRFDDEDEFAAAVSRAREIVASAQEMSRMAREAASQARLKSAAARRMADESEV